MTIPIHKPTHRGRNQTGRGNRARRIDAATLRAYRATWSRVWRQRIESGGFSPDEEETERRALLQEVAGVTSSKDLDTTTAAAVMLALKSELGEKFTDPYRARRVAKIEHLLTLIEHAKPDPLAYLAGIFRRTNPDLDPADWKTRLTSKAINALMLELIAQARREGHRV